MYSALVAKGIAIAAASFTLIMNAPLPLTPFSCLSFSTYDCVDSVPAVGGGAGAASQNGTTNTAPTGTPTPQDGTGAAGTGN